MRSLLFQLIHLVVCRFPVLVSLVSILAAGGLGTYGAMHMELITDQDRLLSEDLDYHKRYMDFIRRFGDLEFLYVFIEGDDRGDMVAYAEALEARVSTSPDIRTILYRFPTTWISDYRLLYASEDDLEQLESELQANQNDINQLYEYNSIHDVLMEIADSVESGSIESASPATDSLSDIQPLLDAMRGEAGDHFEAFSTMRADMEAQLPDEYEYLWSERGNALLMFIMPEKDFSTLSVIEEPLARIRSDIQLTNTEFAGRATAGLTGRPALMADEMSTTNNDMIRASLTALVGVSILFILFFREIIRPALAIASLLMAMGWTYGVVSLTLGHLNLLSTVFALVLIGLGVDFGIHFLHRYQEELKRFGTPEDAVLHALKRVGPGIITGAVTSSIAFLLALFTEFLGLAELGYVAGIGILFCLIAMLVTLPALLVTVDRYIHSGRRIPTPVHLSPLHYPSRIPLLVVLAIIVVSAVGYPRALEVRFDDNLLNLQADGLESVEIEHRLLDESDYSTWYCAFTRSDMQAVRETVERLNAEPSVAKTQSLADVLPEITPAQRTRLDSIQEKLQAAASHESVAYQPAPIIVQHVWRVLDTLFQQVDGLAAGEGTPSLDSIPEEQLATMSDEQLNQLMAMEEDSAPEIAPESLALLRELFSLLSESEDEINTMLARAHDQLLEEPRSLLAELAGWTSNREPNISDLPEEYQTLYVGDDNSLLIMAFPRENIWDQEPMRVFVSAMRAIDPDVTGTPIQVYESSLLMREAFSFIGLLSIGVVAVLVFLDFFRPSALLFVVGPLLLGVYWMLLMMGQFDIHLNLANFFAIPILIGIGVDNAVHFYHRYLETGSVEKTMTTTGTTLTLTTLTTIAGFGSLMFAAHKGLASMGALMTLGTATCWFACVIFLSAILKLFFGSRKSSRYQIDSL